MKQYYFPLSLPQEKHLIFELISSVLLVRGKRLPHKSDTQHGFDIELFPCTF